MSTAHKILLIEDDRDLVTLYRLALEKKGFVVYTASDGMQGINKSFEKNIDLILLDLMMPLSDGRDVLGMLKTSKQLRDIPVIIISNLDRGVFDISDLDDQVMDYWIKSEISPKILAARIHSYFS